MIAEVTVPNIVWVLIIILLVCAVIRALVGLVR